MAVAQEVEQVAHQPEGLHLIPVFPIHAKVSLGKMLNQNCSWWLCPEWESCMKERVLHIDVFYECEFKWVNGKTVRKMPFIIYKDMFIYIWHIVTAFLFIVC